MGTLIFATGVAIEIALALICITARSNRQRLRNIVRLSAFAGFAALAALRVIDWSLRYYALAAFLLALALAGAIALVRRSEDRREYRSRRVILRAVGMSGLLFLFTLPAMIFPQYRAIEPTGQYPVATAAYTYTDPSRAETYADNGESRRLTVGFWYPDGVSGKYPLIVFSHGSFGIKTSNESLYRELASHGYVVCAIDHTYQSLYTTDVEHHTALVDMGYAKEIMNEDAGADPQQSYQYYQKWMGTRTADMNFVIDRILTEAESTNAAGAYGLVDTARVGVIGHSLGGSAALGLGRMRHDVGAVIALESPFMCDIQGVQDGKFVFTDAAYPVPLLNVYSDDGWNLLADAPQYAENYALLSTGRPNVFNVHIGGAGHLSLSDLALTSPFLAGVISKTRPTVDARQCLTEVNKMAVEFLDCYLKGQGQFSSNSTR